MRSLALKTVPYTDLLGSMALFGFFLAVMNLILEARHSDRSLGPFLMPVSLFFLVVSFAVPHAVDAPRNDLKGPVFAFHVTLNMLSYSAFAVACALSRPLPRPRAAAEEQATQHPERARLAASLL